MQLNTKQLLETSSIAFHLIWKNDWRSEGYAWPCGIYFGFDICEHRSWRVITFYFIFGYPVPSPKCERLTNVAITMNTASSCPHDFRNGYPEFLGRVGLREALEIAEPGLTKESWLV